MRSIICNAQSIQGILDESKTATRRVIVPQPQSQGIKEYGEAWEWHRSKKTWFSGATLEQVKASYGLRQDSPYGLPGDKLWVRESFCKFGYRSFEWLLNTQNWVYKASATDWDLEMMKINRMKWTSPLFMPRIASRITLKIEDVQVERIQDITDKGIISEGISKSELFNLGYFPGNLKELHRPENDNGKLLYGLYGTFAKLWDSINLKRGYGWDFNPWVWVIDFSIDSVSIYITSYVNDWNTGWMVERDLDYYLVHEPMSVKTDGSPRFRTRQQVNKVLRSVATSETPVYTYDDIAKIANELDVQIWGS